MVNQGAQEITVFAASSLSEAFEEMARAFEAEYGVRVSLHFAGSSTLSTQLLLGARADVFASANPEQVQRLVQERLVKTSQSFARNQLSLITPSSSSMSDIAQLADDGIALVLAAPEVPAGRYARQVLTNVAQEEAGFLARVLANIVSEELNVRQVAAKVALGEADAAFVYDSDVARLKNVSEIPIPVEANVSSEYVIAPLDEGNIELAQRFVDFVLARGGQDILVAWGFSPK